MKLVDPKSTYVGGEQSTTFSKNFDQTAPTPICQQKQISSRGGLNFSDSAELVLVKSLLNEFAPTFGEPEKGLLSQGRDKPTTLPIGIIFTIVDQQ